MEIKEQPATAEQKETIKKLHNEGIKRIKISAYLIAALICVGATFIFRLKAFNFVGSYYQVIDNILYAGAVSFGILIISRFIQEQIAKGSLEKGLLYNL